MQDRGGAVYEGEAAFTLALFCAGGDDDDVCLVCFLGCGGADARGGVAFCVL